MNSKQTLFLEEIANFFWGENPLKYKTSELRLGSIRFHEPNIGNFCTIDFNEHNLNIDFSKYIQGHLTKEDKKAFRNESLRTKHFLSSLKIIGFREYEKNHKQVIVDLKKYNYQYPEFSIEELDDLQHEYEYNYSFDYWYKNESIFKELNIEMLYSKVNLNDLFFYIFGWIAFNYLLQIKNIPLKLDLEEFCSIFKDKEYYLSFLPYSNKEYILFEHFEKMFYSSLDLIISSDVIADYKRELIKINFQR